MATLEMAAEWTGEMGGEAAKARRVTARETGRQLEGLPGPGRAEAREPGESDGRVETRRRVREPTPSPRPPRPASPALPVALSVLPRPLSLPFFRLFLPFLASFPLYLLLAPSFDLSLTSTPFPVAPEAQGCPLALHWEAWGCGVVLSAFRMLTPLLAASPHHSV